MRRRDFNRLIGCASATALISSTVSTAWAQEAWDEEDYEAGILDEVLNELSQIEGQRIDAVGRSELPSEDRAALRINGTDAGFPVPPLTEELLATLTERRYWSVAASDRPLPDWAGARSAPDYQHLAGFALSSAQFELSAPLLLTLAERNAFEINDTRPVLIFGLRGCMIEGDADQAPWAAMHRLEAIDPTHLECRCVIGVLRKSDGMIALFRGSTIPAVASMYKSLPINGAGTSLLPTGLYRYSAGAHRAAYPTRIQRGALRLYGSQCVLRTADDLKFDAFSEGDAWTRGAMHNIHSAGRIDRYDSAGCQVIPGGYSGADRQTSVGSWSDFQRTAGLIDEAGAFIAADTEPTFQYMLLTGREAAIAYQGGAAFNNAYLRLRPGSTGEEVRALQERLFGVYTGIEGAQVDGDFGMLTAFAVLLHKKDTEGEFTSPIVSI